MDFRNVNGPALRRLGSAINELSPALKFIELAQQHGKQGQFSMLVWKLVSAAIEELPSHRAMILKAVEKGHLLSSLGVMARFMERFSVPVVLSSPDLFLSFSGKDMERKLDAWAALSSRELYYSMIRELLSGYAREGKLWSIDLRKDGHATTEYAEFMSETFDLLEAPVHVARPEGLPRRREVDNRENISVVSGGMLDEDLLQVTLFQGKPDHVYGRTLEFRREDKAYHFKFLREGEEPGLLEYEYDMMNYLASKKEEWGLLGFYPKGVYSLKRVRVDQLPLDMAEALKGKGGPIVLDEHDGYYTFMAYEVELDEQSQNNFSTYLNDPDLSHEEFLAALRVNVHDRFQLARRGLYDSEIIELFHDVNDGGRLFNWMREITEVWDDNGTGRIHDMPGATLYPNLRLSGGADFAQIRFIDDLIEDEDLQERADGQAGKLVGIFKQRAKNYEQASKLGDMLLSIALVVDEYLLRRGELNYEYEAASEDTLLNQALQILFEEAYRAFVGEDEIPEELTNLNHDITRRQMAMFLTTAYVPYLQKRAFPAEIYPDAEVGFGEDKVLSEGHAWDVEKTTYTVPSRNPDLHVERASHDLGFFNGANPVQELIRSLYRATTMMIVGQYTAQIPGEIIDVVEKEIGSAGENSDVGGLNFDKRGINLERLQGTKQEIRDETQPAVAQELWRSRVRDVSIPISGVSPILLRMHSIDEFPLN